MGNGHQHFEFLLREGPFRIRGIERQQPDDFISRPHRHAERGMHAHFLQRLINVARTFGALIDKYAGALFRHAFQDRFADPHLLTFVKSADGNRHRQLIFIEQTQHASIGAGAFDDDGHNFVHQLIWIENSHQFFANPLDQAELHVGQRFSHFVW